MWRKKGATINLPISIASYVFQTWVEANNMKELQRYIFYKETTTRNSDPRGVITHFYNIAFQKSVVYKHRSLENVEEYRNVSDEGEIAKIDALLSKNKVPL